MNVQGVGGHKRGKSKCWVEQRGRCDGEAGDQPSMAVGGKVRCWRSEEPLYFLALTIFFSVVIYI